MTKSKGLSFPESDSFFEGRLRLSEFTQDIFLGGAQTFCVYSGLFYAFSRIVLFDKSQVFSPSGSSLIFPPHILYRLPVHIVGESGEMSASG